MFTSTTKLFFTLKKPLMSNESIFLFQEKCFVIEISARFLSFREITGTAT